MYSNKDLLNYTVSFVLRKRKEGDADVQVYHVYCACVEKEA